MFQFFINESQWFYFSIIKGLEQNPISKAKYIELKKDIDLTCKLLDTTIVKLTFIVVLLPPLLISGVNYFIYDLKDESYFLICPIMWVVRCLFSQKFRIHAINKCFQKATIQLANTARILGGNICPICEHLCSDHIWRYIDCLFHLFVLAICLHCQRYYDRFALVGLQQQVQTGWSNNKATLLYHHSDVFGCQAVEWIVKSTSVVPFLFHTLYNLIIYSLVDEYNAIYKYIIASFFWWTILAISSTMIMLEIQLVEYSEKQNVNRTNFFKKKLFHFSKVRAHN